jgi:hypothetical protein
MKRIWIQLLTLSSALFIANVSCADTITWSGGSGNWDNDASWGGTEPTGVDVAILGNGSTITVNLAGETAARLSVTSGTVEVETGGNLALTGTGESSTFGLNGGNLLISGGAVTANASVNDFIQGGSTMSITSGSFSRSAGITRIGDSTPGTLTVSGTGSYSGGNLRLINTGTVNLTGSSASITGLSQIRALGGVNNFNLTLGNSGINAISTTGEFTLTGTSTLSLNLLAYDVVNGDQVNLFAWGGTPTADWDTVLINGTSLGSISVAAPSTTPFTAGLWQGDFVVAANSIYLDNLEIIPEPSAFALLVAGLGLIAAARRRMR